MGEEVEVSFGCQCIQSKGGGRRGKGGSKVRGCIHPSMDAQAPLKKPLVRMRWSARRPDHGGRERGSSSKTALFSVFPDSLRINLRLSTKKRKILYFLWKS